MTKTFNKGDKVRIVGNSGDYIEAMVAGKIGTFTGYWGGDQPQYVPFPYYVMIPGYGESLLMGEKDIELFRFQIGDKVTAATDLGQKVKKGMSGEVVGVYANDDAEYDAIVFPIQVRFDIGGGQIDTWPTMLCEVEYASQEAPVAKPSIAKDISLYPQTKTVLRHLEKRGTISPMEALMGYGIYRLSARINELRGAGYKIKTTIKKDEAGHRYARYTLAA